MYDTTWASDVDNADFIDNVETLNEIDENDKANYLGETIREQVNDAMSFDDAAFIRMYKGMSDEQREAVDETLNMICGWPLLSLVELAIENNG